MEEWEEAKLNIAGHNLAEGLYLRVSERSETMERLELNCSMGTGRSRWFVASGQFEGIL